MSALPTAPAGPAEPPLEHVLRAMRCIVWRVSVPSMANLYVSANAAELLGYPPEAWRDPEHWRRIVHPDDRAAVEAAVGAALVAGEPYEREFRMLRPDGHALWLHDSVAFTRDAAGRIVEMQGVALDVTARRLREDALHYDRERRQLAMSLARVAAWEWRVDADRIVGDPQGLSMLGREWAGVRSLADFVAVLHPDDRTAIERAARHSLATGADYRVTFRVPVADGECRHFESWGRPAGEDGTYHTLVGASRDVTDEHRALRAAQLRSLLLDSLGEGVSVARGDGTLVYVNAALERMLGYAPGELLGRPVRMLSSRSQADYDLRASQITGVIDARGHWSGPMTSRRKDGALLQTYGTITRAVVDGEPLWITVRQDMTERHRVQRDLLAASQREKEQLAHALHESLAQQLTGTALLAGSMRDEAARRDSALAPAVSRLADLLLEAVGTCRRLAQGVSGFSVRNGGLDLGLRELALAFERRHGGACEVEVDRGVAAALDPETARHLYWIAEDALAIAAREGDGPRAVLRLEPVDSGARLRVRLPGIAPERLEALGGAELKFIGYRAALLGAGMATRPAEGGGVSIDCLCPTGGKTGVLP